jgi:large subunit ribosomal protein L24e
MKLVYNLLWLIKRCSTLVSEDLRERICVVCGKKFPDGQGIVIHKDDIILEFHSSKCASKFFKRLLEEAPDISCIKNTIKQLLEEYKTINEKKREKKI